MPQGKKQQTRSSSRSVVKTHSRRMSSANRHSLANLMGPRSRHVTPTISIKGAGGLGELRCSKHSPRVGQKETHVGEELFIFEATQWRNAFSTMGKLHARGLPAPKPFTVLNKAPYHCPSLGREFEVRYGDIRHMDLPVFRKTAKTDRPQICNCIIKEMLPVYTNKRVSGSFDVQADINSKRSAPKSRYSIPKSTVTVRWDPSFHSNVDKICEWLMLSFGPFFFTVRTARNSMMVAFDTMEQAHRAVTFQFNSTAKICILWCDPAMYNYGHYQKYADYTITSDPIWMKVMEDKKVKSTQRNLGGKSLKISANK